MPQRWLTAFGSYGYRARLLPALLTILPIFLTIMMLYPSVYSGVGTAVGTLAVACGTLWFLASVARRRGRAVEARLVEKWGGLPTTSMLRHSDATLDGHTKQRYHGFLERQVPGLRLPTSHQEQSDRMDADSAYLSAVTWLLEHTRDESRFPLIVAENTAYGFLRNLYGAKPLGIALCLICMGMLAFVIASSRPQTISQVAGSHLLLGVLLVASLMCWLFFVTPASVQDASRAYARALLAACDAVPRAAMSSPNPGRIIAP